VTRPPEDGQSPPISSPLDGELCNLLQGIRRGDVIHPRLKALLVHLGYLEHRLSQLQLTLKAQRLINTWNQQRPLPPG